MIYFSSKENLSILFLLIPLVSLAYNSGVEASIDEVKIGVLMRHRGLEEPLNKTLEMLNADTSVLLNTRLLAIIEMIETNNSYQTSAASKYN